MVGLVLLDNPTLEFPMQIGFHTDAFNSSYWNFDKCLAWAEANGVHFIECGLIDGVSWIHGLGYQPHIALYQDPLLLRRRMERFGVQFSQLDAAYPLSGSDGPLVRRALRAEIDPLGETGRLPADRHHRRPSQAGGSERRRGHGIDEAELWPDRRGGRGLRDLRSTSRSTVTSRPIPTAWSRCWPFAVRPICD